MLRRSIHSPSVPLDCVHRLTDAVKRGLSYSGSTQIVASRTLRPELPGANSAFTFRVLDQSCGRTGFHIPASGWYQALGRDPPARASICTDLPSMNQRHMDGLHLHAQELVVRSPSTPVPQTGELIVLCAPFGAEVDNGLRFTQAARTRSTHTEHWPLGMWFLDRRQWPPQVLGQ